MNSKTHNRLFIIGICLITAIGGVIRFAYVGHNFWLDELTTTWVINDGFGDIFNRAWINNNSPLYYSICLLSSKIFGYSELGLRILTTLSGIITIAIIGLVSWKWSNNHLVGLVAAFICALDPSMVFYSLELRSYSFIILLSILNIYAVIEFCKNTDSKKLQIYLGLSLALLILFHYTAALMAVVDLLIILYIMRKDDLIRIKQLLLPSIIVLLAVIPIISHLIYLFSSNGTIGSFIPKQSITYIFDILPQIKDYVLLPLSFVALILIFQQRSDENKFSLSNSKLIAIWIIVPLLLSWIITKLDIATIFYYRYLSYVIPATIIFASLLLNYIHSRYFKLAFIVLLGFMSARTYAHQLLNSKGIAEFKENMRPALTAVHYNVEMVNGFNWEDAVSMVNSSPKPIDKIYVRSGLIEAKFMATQNNPTLHDYLLSPVNSYYSLKPELLDKAEPIHRTIQIDSSAKNYIIIGYLEEYEKPKSGRLSPSDSKDIHVYYIQK